ncbi:hypothetical protein [Streptomyces griseorubiginosus]|uniref:hypothetical protein n=1 Tax=Streptomyces griseorubiginosus TaxID=67304 RepID=UPI002E8216B9|nr:hypothetical protein [Streptomyces griseorubiginosus]WUB45298.1 hypothetical protein OHN19_18885 [Streptomyces griseorubiginosus]WUB53815.1 hypothetical protein OG942_18880 [Streptomyces griseorubiginosus]
MTDRRPGQWPVQHPVPRDPQTAATAPVTQLPVRVEVPVPDVRLVAVVDLTDEYATHDDVSRALYEQTMRASDCHTAVVRLGEAAIRKHLTLPRAIAGAFFLSAQRIEVHVPAGTRYAYFAARVRQELEQICADHAQMLSSTRTPG